MYKLIAFDLDGTLLNDEKSIDKRNLETIHKLIEKGIKIVINTGRDYRSAKDLTQEIESDLIYICNNGHLVVDSKDDKLIVEKILNKEESKTILAEGEKMGVEPIIHVNRYDEGIDAVVKNSNEFFDPRDKSPIKSSLQIKRVDEFTDEDLEHVLTMAYFGEEKPIKDFYEYMREKYPNKYQSHLMENMMTADSLAEFMAFGGNKWITLYEYAKSIGIEKDEIVAFGDDNNDVEMIENSGLGIGMANGSEKIKELADRISEEDNNNLGIDIELRRIFNLD